MLLLTPALVLVACAPGIAANDAPADLQSVTLRAIQDFGTDGEAEHIAWLVEWLEKNIDSADDGYYFDHLEADDVSMIEHEEDDVSWDRVVGAGVPARVHFSVDEYAAVVPESDQSFAEPSTYSKWERKITSGSEAEFLAGGALGTNNDVEKTEVGITIPYSMSKPYAWFDGGVLAAQSVVPKPGYDKNDLNGIVVGFTIEIWVPDGDGAIWYNGSWSELKTQLDDVMTEDGALDLLIDGTRRYYWGTEEYVTGVDYDH